VPFRASGSDFGSVIRQRAELVQRFALFSEIPLEDCAKIVGVAHDGRFKRGKRIFFEGDPVRQVILLTSGCIKLSQCASREQEVILRLVGPGEALCVECFPECNHCSTAEVLERSSALIWDARQFEAVRQRFPLLGRNVSCVLLRTLNQLEVRFREISTEKVAPRLSSQLVRLVQQVGKPSDSHVEIALSQKDLAQLTGTTLFTVSRLLSQWEEQGIVKPCREAVQVLNIPALIQLSQAE
jgi:CRP-like cAMP-binding protein